MCLGIPGRIVAVIDEADSLAMVEVGGVRRPINISFITSEDHPAHSCIGDWVLVHVGFAMSRIDEDEAASTLAILQEMEDMRAEMEAMQQSALP
ncbi:MAG: HypC/HybG/HupF family hydrogenase formation chaperone [Acidisphaera sp.]|nr:HypC/HybG/HupF family hydrogenase formation chaperone [Acidisphaera sp.]